MSSSRQNLLKISSLLLMVGFVTSLHYITGTEHMQQHDVYRRIYYLPIILGGFWFGIRGGAGIALLVSVIYAPHVLFQWGYMPSIHIEQYLEILLYNLIGFTTGFLSSRVYAERLLAEENMQRLTESYTKLREQADLIMEIEDQLRQADRLTALGELSAGMAHEIRNPLGSIRGTAEILRDALPDNTRLTEFSEILINEVDRLNKVVENFLSFARQAPNEQSEFSPDVVLREVIQLTRRQLKKNRIRIIWDETPLPKAIGEAGQFRQVFINLILNAQQVMTEGGRLTIDTPVSDCGQLTLKFRDEGPGIAEENLGKIFNPFFTTRSQGTGLGLAITYRIVRNHGGKITAANAPGGGAEFTITLKAADSPCNPGEQNDTQDTVD